MSSFADRHGLPALGAGIGLRFEHVDRILAEAPPVPWFEIVSENYLHRGGLVRRRVAHLDRERLDPCAAPAENRRD